MGMRRVLLACLSLLLLLMLIELETPCLGDHGYNKLISRSSSEINSLKPHKAFKGSEDHKNGDDNAFGAEMRKVNTGPNPLHNR
ncbi:CLE22p like [Actinidia chinensis var. chinensis]|uniref:CLE22p like n=1 Tax=Actinidia chinensis var. chinensis TaxID=1590841 RepID=A0A2R6RU22_ACTCC|nr:CLE22p like [Actinidia chinensis var. chinensis]